MRIVVLGANGQVGRELVALASENRRAALISLSRADVDLSSPGAAAKAILAARPDAVINAAAYTAVDKAETERAAAFRVNAEAVGEIAEASQSIGARLIHLSTDYVFNGEATSPYRENDRTDPVNAYGASKLEGEGRAIAACANAVVIRTSWVYAAHGNNFLKTMLRHAETKSELRVVDDQRGAPTPAVAVARTALTTALSVAGQAGVYHFQGTPVVSWADFASAIFAVAGLPTKVVRIPTSDYPTVARRPSYSVLDCSKIARDYAIAQPDWREDLPRVIAKLVRSGA
jgi:dTDP-4-dehydrorhamnose reductase